MTLRIRLLPLALAIAGTPLLCNAQTRDAELYVDVATHASPAMAGGGLGRALAGMAGGGSSHYGMTRYPGLPGKYLDIALRIPGKPAIPARQAIPAGLRLGDQLQLVPGTAPREMSGPGVPGAIGDGVADGQQRILYYWGCAESARRGQPREFTVTMRNGKVSSGGQAMQPRTISGHEVEPGPGYATWPNTARGGNKSVPGQASLVGAHQVTGHGIPEDMRFEIEQALDFMPELDVRMQGSAAEGLALQWNGVAGAQGYFIHGMAADGNTIVMWSSAEDGYAGPEMMAYLDDAQLKRLVGKRTVLPAQARDCSIPREVFANAGGMPMLQMIAYGEHRTISRPDWSVRVRNKSTAMLMLGADGTPVDAGEAARPSAKDAAKSVLRGLFGR